MGPVRERICAVFADGRQGSGYLIGPRLVLASGHVVGDAAQARIALLGRRDEVVCRSLWTYEGRDGDAALLLADTDLIADHGSFSHERWGEVSGLGPVESQAIGFPRVQRGADGLLESEQFVGTLKPGTGLVGGRLVIDGLHTPPGARDDGRSPWAGMSGAAVFAGGLLVGVITTDPLGWQHGRMTATPVSVLRRLSEFRELVAQHSLPGLVRRDTDPVADFERRYAAFVTGKHDTLTIFGLDLRDRAAANWPLDAAYLSLEAEASPDGPPGARGEFAGGPRPADEALADRDRVLLRGVAGSGKTTLVQWLAVSAARQELPVGLRHLRGRIPFVLPLRTLARRAELPSSPGDFLGSVRSPLADAQPPGWAARVLDEGRGLLLVDGLDEVDERERDRVRDWLCDLLLVYPRNLWLVTSRPSAVEDGWLASEGFAELTLSPMSRSGVTSFVTRWHAAALDGCRDPEESERLPGYRESLLTAIRTKSDLGRLATNPLMCGMICALHRDRRGYLPHGRKELYDAALAMLVADRDQRRDIGATDGIDLTAEPQIQLLQRLAYWLIRNGRAELSRDHAERLIADALPSVPAAASQGDAAALLRHLLLRSGVLREPVAGTVDFVHRTFQDYLGAKRAVEEWDIGLLVDKAADSQWEDVVRLAVAHARPRERAEILRSLLARPAASSAEGARVVLLAMACLEHATELDPAVREEVLRRGAEFVPPRGNAAARALAEVGPMVLELLPGPEGCPDEETAQATVVAASMIESDAAVPFLSRFATHPSLGVRRQLAWSWRRFDRQEYFDAVIRVVSPEDLEFVAWNNADLRMLVSAGLDERLQLRGSCEASVLDAALPVERLTSLSLMDNEAIRDLGFLRRFPSLTRLRLEYCTGIEDFSALSELPLTFLRYTPEGGNDILRYLPSSVTEVELFSPDGLICSMGQYGASSVTSLFVQFWATEDVFPWVASCFPYLRDLVVFYLGPPKSADASPLLRLPHLRSLTTTYTTLHGADALEAAGVRIRRG